MAGRKKKTGINSADALSIKQPTGNEPINTELINIKGTTEGGDNYSVFADNPVERSHEILNTDEAEPAKKQPVKQIIEQKPPVKKQPDTVPIPDKQPAEQPPQQIFDTPAASNIPEPEYKLVDEDTIEESEIKDKPNISMNEKLNDLDDKDKLFAVEKAIDFTFEMYRGLHELSKVIGKYPEEKIQEYYINKEIDPDILIPISENEGITLLDYVKTHNQEIDSLMVPDEKLLKDIHDPLCREYLKHNIGLNDRQYIAVKVVKDLMTKVSLLAGCKRQMNNILKALKAQTKQMLQVKVEEFDKKSNEIKESDINIMEPGE